MSIGSVLLQPQRLDRAMRLSVDTALGDDIVSLMGRIAFEPLAAEEILNALQTAFESMGDRIVANAGSGLDTGVARLKAMLQPLLDDIDAFTANPPALEAPEDLFAVLLDLAEGLIDILDNLDANALRGHAAELIDILENDWGLSTDLLEAQLWQTVDELIGALNALSLSGEANTTRHALVAVLRRLKRQLRETLDIPTFTAEDLVQLLLDSLRDAGLEGFVVKARCIAQAVRELLSSGTALTALTATFGDNSVGAAAVRSPTGGDQFCWYASWLMRTEGRPSVGFGGAGEFFNGVFWEILAALPGFPYDEVWVTEDRTQVVRRNVFRADEILHEGTNVEWFEAPIFSGTVQPNFTFGGKLDHDFMENWARYHAAANDFIKVVLHAIDLALEPQDVASNSGHILWNFVNAPLKFGAGKPLLSLINAALGAPPAVRWAWNQAPIIMTLLAALENQHEVADKSTLPMYATLLAEDALEAITFDAITETVRDVALSLFTLINYEGASYPPDVGDDNRPLNRNFNRPFISLTSLGTAWLLTRIIPREDYSYPFDGRNDVAYAWWLIGGPVAGAVGAMLGTALATFGIAGASDGALLGKRIAGNAISSVFTFWVSFYSFMEGNTAGGTYNPRGQDFAGYPDYETSPYRLPYPLNTSQFCDQANQGMWSHNDKAGTAQVYAYDFAHDQAEQVVAARDGTVVDYFDWVSNDTDPDADQAIQIRKDANASGFLVSGQTGEVTLTAAEVTSGLTVNQKIDRDSLQSPSWNFVLIRHDNPFDAETEAQRAGHDKAADGQRVVTYSVYGHGRLDGVRDALTAATPNNDATEIIGLQIRRGTPLMLAGNTGNSFHNHLHIDVRTDNTAPPTPPAAYPGVPVRLSAMIDVAIPFVFGDVTNPFSMNGRPVALNHYKSGNEPEVTP